MFTEVCKHFWERAANLNAVSGSIGLPQENVGDIMQEKEKKEDYWEARMKKHEKAQS